MVKLLKSYKLCIPILLVIICAISIYIYNYVDNSSDKYGAALSSALTPVEKVSKFNSLVPGIFILNESGESYETIAAIFSSVGYDIMEGSLEDYKRLRTGECILLVSEKEADKLSAEGIGYIAEKIHAGGRAITWGRSALSERLGIVNLDGSKEISGYTWIDKSDVVITFKNPTSFKQFSVEENMKVYAIDKNSKPVMISGSYGKGSFIYSGISLVGDSRLSYEHFPFILDAVQESFGVKPVISRDDLALYVDIDYHKNDNPAELAARIKTYGANQINLSAWYSKDEYGQLYERIIEECHKRGISVFAWFELPFVSTDFWESHPEWREKTASGEDAHIDWRRLMALSNPDALEGIKNYTADFIKSYDWDGVDIAEIYFESPGEGFRNKDKFTPMNDSFRESFKHIYGADPKDAFNPLSINYWKYNKKMKQNIIDYRVELITKLHEEFLLLCEELKKEKPYLQTSVTVIDSIADNSMRENIGVEAEAIAKLQAKYHFMLQIEDPYTLWNLGPDRYKVIGEEYRSIMSEGNYLSIDINVIDRGGEVYPTKKQRGMEIYQLINNANKYTDKVILYALATLEKADMEYVPYTTSDDVSLQEISHNEYISHAGKRFIWNTAAKDKTYYIDGVKWPFVSSQGVIIPGGEHRIAVIDKEDSSNLLIESINNEIFAVSRNEGINFSYDSEGRFYVVLRKKPKHVRLDGKPYNPDIIEGSNSCTVILPNGKHKVGFN